MVSNQVGGAQGEVVINGSVTVTTLGVLVTPGVSAVRRTMIITNEGLRDCWLNIGTSDGINVGILLARNGDRIVFGTVSDIYAYTATSTTELSFSSMAMSQ